MASECGESGGRGDNPRVKGECSQGVDGESVCNVDGGSRSLDSQGTTNPFEGILRGPPKFMQVSEGDGSVALREARARLVQCQWHVNVSRDRDSEQRCQRRLSGRLRQQIVASYHLVDMLEAVIDHRCQVVRGHAVSATQYEVIDGAGERTVEFVEYGPLACWGAKAERGSAPEFGELLTSNLALSVSQVEARAGVVTRRNMGSGRGFFNVLAGAVALERISLLDQVIERLHVCGRTRRLHQYCAIPVQSDRFQVSDLAVGAARTHAVNIFHAQDKRAPAITRPGPSEDRGSQIPDVKIPGGRGRKTPHALLNDGTAGHGFSVQTVPIGQTDRSCPSLVNRRLDAMNDSAKPVQRIWPYVAVGGALGALVRAGVDYLTVFFPDSVVISHAVPIMWSTVLVNLLGAFVLGVVVPLFADPSRERVRLLVATGFLGAFTTYGTLIVATANGMIASGSIVGAIVPALVSLTLLFLGVVCAGCGFALGRFVKFGVFEVFEVIDEAGSSVSSSSSDAAGMLDRETFAEEEQ